MKQQNHFEFEKQTREKLRQEIAMLAKAYTPEWIFDKENPDMGSTIALIFANQTEDIRKQWARLLERYHRAFVNLLDISLLPAYPAMGVVIMNVLGDMIEGVIVPKQSKLLAEPEEESEEAEDLIFETKRDVYITSAKLTDIISISRKAGKIIPILGSLQMADPCEIAEQEEEQEEAKTEELEEGTLVHPFSLFENAEKGVQKNELYFCHPFLFDVTEEEILIRFMGNSCSNRENAERFSNGTQYRFSYYGKNGFAPFETVSVAKDYIALKKTEELQKITIEGMKQGVICMEALQPVKETLHLSSIQISTSGGEKEPEFLTFGTSDLNPEKFLPFGESISLFQEFYIGSDMIFEKKDAWITLSFQLSFTEHIERLTPEEEEVILKPIKRKPRNHVNEIMGKTVIQLISIEYYNGTGFCRLDCGYNSRAIFDGKQEGRVEIQFLCPKDWEPLTVGGYTGRSIRFQVTKADNCYLRPCKHIVPVMQDVKIAYTYRDHWNDLHCLKRVYGTQTKDLTKQLLENRNFVAFAPLPYEGNSLFLGFDRKIDGMPASMLFEMEEKVPFHTTSLRFEYSTKEGFRPLKVIDQTENLFRSGMVYLLIPSDFSSMEIEGLKRHWIRIVDAEGKTEQENCYHAKIKNIFLNAVEVLNIETLQEEPFYLDQVVPEMSFSLGTQNILRAEVFVNEKDSLTQEQMQQMLCQEPENVRVTYDAVGNFEDFFVRWSEVSDLSKSEQQDRHYQLDRLYGRIQFGDVTKTKVPSVTDRVAFTVRVQVCGGAHGNLPEHKIQTLASHIIYIDNVDNPIPTYGGSDLETIESAYARGASILSSKGRLVSEIDFMREVKAFSQDIDKVKLIKGRTIEGEENERTYCFVLLMKDYQKGSYSFNRLKERLRDHLFSKCEMVIKKEDFLITEPIYVSISVEIWIVFKEMVHIFDVQNDIIDRIQTYLDPLSKEYTNGWEIGVLPEESQLKMLISSLPYDFFLKACSISVEYTDQRGKHETTLEKLKENPFVLGINGNHKVHVEIADS